MRRSPLAIAFFVLLAFLVLYGTGKVLLPFLNPVLLAATLVVLTYPWYRRIRERFGGRKGMAASLTLLLVNLCVILPLAVLVGLLIDQAMTLAGILQKTDLSQTISAIHGSERLNAFLASWHLPPVDLRKLGMGVIGRAPALVAVQGGRILGGAAGILIGYFLMQFAMFYFYTEGEFLLREMVYLSPLPDRFDRELIDKFRHVISATFRGHMLTAAAQGAMTGIGMAVAGIPGSMFWGAVAAVFALLPLVGAAMVWIPATAYLFFSAYAGHGSYGWAIFMLLWGALGVSLIDNVIRPWAMKGGTDMSAVLVLFSVLGGVAAFGFIGMILGPLFFALFVSMIHIYKTFFAATLERQNEE